MTENTRPAILSNPEAFVVVPVEPIREQWAAMADTLYRYKNRHHDKVAGDVFNALLAARPNPTALSDIAAYCAELEEENARLREALAIARRSILEGGGGGVCCTVWVPSDVSPSETLVDYIEAALSTKGEA